MRKTCFASLAWIAVAPFLTSCVGYIISPVPPPPKQQDAWLSFKFQSGNGSPGCGSFQNPSCQALLQDDAEAIKYYNGLGIADTLNYPFGQWLTDHHFPTDPTAIAHATYANKLDLQFGRDMYCWHDSQTIPCYVVNYGPPPFVNGAENPAWPDLTGAINDANSHNNPFATVAMVYNPANATNTVSFYVFNNQKAVNADPNTSPLALEAALDAEGGKTVPRMCMSCHGGFYTPSAGSTAPAVAGATFLPFDVISFGLAADDQAQLAFLNLNAFVLATNPPTATADFINGTYPDYLPGGIGAPFSKPKAGRVVDFIPSGDWQQADDPDPNLHNPVHPSAVYGSVVREYCRMCHLAQSEDFATYAKFKSRTGLVESYVCGIGDMPHMEVPFGSQTNKILQAHGTGFWLDVDPQPRQLLHDFLQGVNGTTACPVHP